MKEGIELLNKKFITGLNYQLKDRDIPIQIPDEKTFNLPVKVIILGNNKLLRSSIDYFFDILIKRENYDGKLIHIELASEKEIDDFNKQEGLYTLVSRGLKNNEKIDNWNLITSIDKILSSNNWNKVIKDVIDPNIEILICHYNNESNLFDRNDSIKNKPPKSYIGKIISILYERYRRYKSKGKDLVVISVNPVLENDLDLLGMILKASKEWNLGEHFLKFVRLNIQFFNTMIDKMDIGSFSEEEKLDSFNKLHYRDNFLTLTENYSKWIISIQKAPKEDFPISGKNLNLEFTKNLATFDSLDSWFNAVMVAFIPLAYLSGYNKTNDALKDIIIQEFFEKFLFDTIKNFVDLPENEIRRWEKFTVNRLKNPYNKRTLIDMSKKLITKFNNDFLYKIIELYERNKEIPDYIFFILATFLRFYNVIEEEDGKFIGFRRIIEEDFEADIETDIDEDEDEELINDEIMNDGDIYQLNDDPEILKEFSSTWRNVKIDDLRSIEIFLGYILTQKNIWGMDLTLWPELLEKTSFYLIKLLQEDIGKVTSELLLGINA